MINNKCKDCGGFTVDFPGYEQPMEMFMNKAVDVHHGTPMMNTIFRLREKYNLHMKVE